MEEEIKKTVEVIEPEELVQEELPLDWFGDSPEEVDGELPEDFVIEPVEVPEESTDQAYPQADK